MSPAFLAWGQALSILVPLVVQGVQSLVALIASIRATPGLSAAEQDELIARLRPALQEEVDRVLAVPVFVPPAP